MVAPTPKSGILIKRYESTVNIMQLYNLAKLRKWKNKYTIQFLEVEFPLHSLFWKAPPKMKKCQHPLKNFFENQKVYPHSLRGEDTIQWPID